MSIKGEEYLEKLKEDVYNKISATINISTIDSIVETHLYQRQINTNESAVFLSYYFNILQNEEFFIKSDFFREFKRKYALQGIDNKCLDRLENQKKEILKLIQENKLVELYFQFFYQVEIQRKDTFSKKDLGSFFSKFIHTFKPDEYCALDNPIKKFFGLKNEGFVTSFFIISEVYKQWAIDNQKLIKKITESIKIIDKAQLINYDKLTDLKLLDLIFWGMANPVNQTTPFVNT